MAKQKKIKIKVDNVSLIFGKNKEQALKMLEQGASKAEILEKAQCTVGVDRASFDIYEGEIFVIMGLSGSGKSTLLRCLNRLYRPTTGHVYINGEDITEKSSKELLEIRRTEMSMVFQSFGLLPHRTVWENAAFGLEIKGEDKAKQKQRAMEALKTVGLEGYENQYPRELSGGMQQRVGLARAIANNPEVLLMDEAFSALDPLIKSDMQDELLDIQDKLHKTIVFITHDLDEAIKLGDRIAIMKDGVIEQLGTAEDIITSPASDYVSAFVEKVDRKNIITAGTLMFEKPTVLMLGKDGPEGALRKMREVSLEILPVVDNNRKFVGFVWLNDAIKAAKNKQTELLPIVKIDVPSIHRNYTVEEMLPLISGIKLPLPVVDEITGKLLGLVTQTSLIIESTRFDNEDEISEMKEQAKAYFKWKK